MHSYRLVPGLVRVLVEAGETDPLPVETAARIIHAVVGSAPADRPRAFEDARTVVLRLAEGMRRR